MGRFLRRCSRDVKKLLVLMMIGLNLFLIRHELSDQNGEITYEDESSEVRIKDEEPDFQRHVEEAVESEEEINFEDKNYVSDVVDDDDLGGVVKEIIDETKLGIFANRKKSRNRPKFGNFDLKQFQEENMENIEENLKANDLHISDDFQDDADLDAFQIPEDNGEIEKASLIERKHPLIKNKDLKYLKMFEEWNDNNDLFEDNNLENNINSEPDILPKEYHEKNHEDYQYDENDFEAPGTCLKMTRFLKETLQSNHQASLQCDLMAATTEKDCLKKKIVANDFFQDRKTQERVHKCENYFDSIDTLAFEEPTKDELEIPIAFSIVAHSQIGLIEAQLALLFRPHNSYCIYIDKKAKPEFRNGINKLVSCYKQKFGDKINLFVAPNPISIFWSDFSLIQADLECIDILLKTNSKWKFFINQAGTALPQVSLLELVSTLKSFNENGGDSIIKSKPFPEKYLERIKFKYRRPSQFIQRNRQSFGNGIDKNEAQRIIEALEKARAKDNDALSMYEQLPRRTFIKKEKPPFGLQIFKGLKEVVISRKSAKFFIESTVGQSLINWCEDITFAEEILFPTLIRISQDVYEKTGKVIQDKNPDLDLTHGICVRRTLWEESVRKCHGQMKRYICNFALSDLPEVLEKNCLFMNKFDLEVDPSAATCLYQHWINKARTEFQ